MRRVISTLIVCCLFFAIGAKGQNLYVNKNSASYIISEENIASPENDNDKTQTG